jgi:CO/xanthine dehydrogenase FAD-binding subunit
MPAYARPTDLTEALELLARGHHVLAGGTDLYPPAGATLAGDILDISALSGLQGISLDNGLRIGATTTWTEIAEAKLPPALHALQLAARVVGGRQIQNAGTIGGNVTNASPAADGVPPLLILNAEVELTSLEETRRLALSDYLKGPRRVDLRPVELLTALHIPAASLLGRSTFLKLGARSHLVISIAMVALRVVTEGGRITDAFAAVGSCSATALRLSLVEQALIAGAEIVPAHLEALNPIDDIRATADYRREAALELLRRAAEELRP